MISTVSSASVKDKERFIRWCQRPRRLAGNQLKWMAMTRRRSFRLFLGAVASGHSWWFAVRSKAKASHTWRTCRSGIIDHQTGKNIAKASRNFRKAPHENPVCRYVLRDREDRSAPLHHRCRYLTRRIDGEIS